MEHAEEPSSSSPSSSTQENSEELKLEGPSNNECNLNEADCHGKALNGLEKDTKVFDLKAESEGELGVDIEMKEGYGNNVLVAEIKDNIVFKDTTAEHEQPNLIQDGCQKNSVKNIDVVVRSNITIPTYCDQIIGKEEHGDLEDVESNKKEANIDEDDSGNNVPHHNQEDLSCQVTNECQMIKEKMDDVIIDDQRDKITVGNGNQGEPFPDLSDLAYVTNIVLDTSIKKSESRQETKNDNCVSMDHDQLLEMASKKLGRRLVAVDYDSSGTEDSSESTSSSSSSSTTTQSSSSSSSSSSESSDEEQLSNMKQMIDFDDNEGVHRQPPKTKDEVLPQELPEVDELLVELPEDAKLEPVGGVQNFVELMLVVKAFKDTPALDADTIFYRKDRKPFGKVYDVFGPVESPFYIIRVSSEEKFKNMKLEVGDVVYYAPNFLNVTNFVFVEQLKKMKGSDASWQHDQEPPPEFLDYSDDEEEAKAKSAAKKKRQNGRKHLLDESSNDADAEDDAALEGKFRKEKRKHFNVRAQQMERTASQGNDPRQTHSGGSSRGRGTFMNGPPHRPFKHRHETPRPSRFKQEERSHAMRFNPRFGEPRNGSRMVRAIEPGHYPENQDLRFPNNNLDGSASRYDRMDAPNATAVNRDTFASDQPMAPFPRPRAPHADFTEFVHNSTVNNATQIAFSGQMDGPMSTSYWPRFDPSVPPPMFPPRGPPGAFPRFPPGAPPPNLPIRNQPPFHGQNLPPPHIPPPNW